jgi:hypothetical protein
MDKKSKLLNAVNVRKIVIVIIQEQCLDQTVWVKSRIGDHPDKLLVIDNIEMLDKWTVQALHIPIVQRVQCLKPMCYRSRNGALQTSTNRKNYLQKMDESFFIGLCVAQE